MSTVKDVFRQAISDGNWNEICRVFTAITGEVAPAPPTAQEPSLTQLLDQPMDGPADMEMPEVGPAGRHSVEDEEDLIASEDGLIAPAEPPPSMELPESQVLVPDSLPTSAPEPADDDPVSEFRIQHGDPQSDDGDGVQCRREAMSIPGQRKNLFRDNGKAFADEKVTADPNNPKLGIQSIRPRTGKRAEDLGADTGTKVNVVCSFCGKEETVAARLAQGHNKNPEHNTYRCNGCSTPNGRAKVMRERRNASINGGSRRSQRG